MSDGPWVSDDVEPLTHETGNEYTLNWRTVWVHTSGGSIRITQHQGGVGVRFHSYEDDSSEEENVVMFTPDFGQTPDD